MKEAVTETAWSDDTVAAETVKEALKAPAATAAVEGAVSREALLVDSKMEPAAVAGVVRVAVQLADPLLASVEGVQESEAS